MAITSRTYNFASSAEGWVAYDDTDTSSAWNGYVGNPPGCLTTTYSYASSGLNHNGPRWELTDTWANILPSIPAGSKIKKVRGYVDTRCISAINMALIYYGDGTLHGLSYYNGAPNSSWDGRAPAGAEGSWTAGTTDRWVVIPSDEQDLTNTVTFWLISDFTSIVGPASCELRWDSVKIEVEYDSVLTAESGSYTLTGQNLNFGRTLVCDSGSYTYTGYDTGLLHYALALDSGSYAVTGYDVGLNIDRTIEAIYGSYTLTGYATGVLFGRLLEAAQGSYSLTGYAASLSVDLKIGLDYGSYAVTGDDSDIWKTSFSDLRNIVYDLWLAYDDPADYDTSGDTREFKLPFHIAYMYGFGGGSGGAKHGQASDPVNEREMLILDANDRVVIDTALIESGHETIYYRRTWSSDLEIVGWEKKHAVLFVVVFISPTSDRKGHAILDGHF